MIELGERAVKKALELGADEAEVFINEGKLFYVSLEANDIKLTKSQISDGVGIRVFKNKGLGFASINNLTSEKVLHAVFDAVRLASLAPADEANQLPLPSKQILFVKDIYDPQVENLTMFDILNYASTLLNFILTYDSRILIDSGIFSISFGESAIISSTGIKVCEKRSFIEYGIMGMAKDKEEVSCFQYEFDSTRTIKDINVTKTGENFVKKVLKSLGAQKGESFKGTIIIEPEVFSELLGVVLNAVSANNVQKRMSRWSGKLQQKVLSDLLTIEDNATIPGGVASSSFDREGIARQPITIINKGVLANYLYNSYCANKEKRLSTGHATGSTRSIPLIGASNVLVSAGEKKYIDLIKEIKRGIYITRLSFQPNPISGDFAGVVKGGFLIEDGVFKKPLIETMIAGNIFSFLNQISGLSLEQRKVGSYILPFCRIEDVSITSG